MTTAPGPQAQLVELITPFNDHAAEVRAFVSAVSNAYVNGAPLPDHTIPTVAQVVAGDLPVGDAIDVIGPAIFDPALGIVGPPGP